MRSGRFESTTASTENVSVVGDSIAASEISTSSRSTQPMAGHPETPAVFGASSSSDDTLVPSVAAVPIYEYVCMECESHFEELVRGEEQVACPDCAATNVSRQFSTFAVHGVDEGRDGGGGGGCCGGSCGCGH